MVIKGVIIVLGLLTMVNRSFTLSCLPCHEVDCGPSPSCSYGVIKDVCNCCDVCAKGPGERCGGPWGVFGTCSKGLECQLDDTIPGSDFNKDGICVDNVQRDNECPSFCHEIFLPVCGSDGNTYDNECELSLASCRNLDDNIVVEHEGKCENECPIVCPMIFLPVCGSDGITYGNECGLSLASCRNPDQNIVVKHKGKCENECPIVCPMIFLPVCGSDGITYGNECGLSLASCRNPDQNIVVKHKGKCGD